MKVRVKHGGAVRCDDVFVDGDENFKDECRETFLSYSLSSYTRGQAKNVGWRFVKAKLVRWRGNPPCGPGKSVDLCAGHAHLVMTDEEYEKHKAEAKAKRKQERDELRKINQKAKREQKKAAKAAAKSAAAAKPPKAKKPRKTKATAAEASPF